MNCNSQNLFFNLRSGSWEKMNSVWTDCHVRAVKRTLSLRNLISGPRAKGLKGNVCTGFFDWCSLWYILWASTAAWLCPPLEWQAEGGSEIVQCIGWRQGHQRWSTSYNLATFSSSTISLSSISVPPLWYVAHLPASVCSGELRGDKRVPLQWIVSPAICNIHFAA